MFTVRGVGGIALFLFATTYLWLTPAFASRDVSTEGFMWALARLLAFMTITGFLVATWGLLHQDWWWEALAVLSATLGLVTLVPYWVAATRAGEVAPSYNVLIHALGSGGVLLLLLVPGLERWVHSHVMGS